MQRPIDIPAHILDGIRDLVQQEFDAGTSAEIATARLLVSATVGLRDVFDLEAVEAAVLVLQVATLGTEEARHLQRRP